MPMHQEHTETQKARLKLLENRGWFEENIEGLMKEYSGRVVAVHDSRVVAVASNPLAPGELQVREVKEKIKGLCPDDEVLVIMLPVSGIAEIYYPT